MYLVRYVEGDFGADKREDLKFMREMATILCIVQYVVARV
jgi:hypothetical protein